MKFMWNWSACNVFYHEKRDVIFERAEEISGGAPGSRVYLGSLQDAITHFWKKLSADEIVKYQKTAKDWSLNAPPNYIQAR
jgi:hypothetical protein